MSPLTLKLTPEAQGTRKFALQTRQAQSFDRRAISRARAMPTIYLEVSILSGNMGWMRGRTNFFPFRTALLLHNLERITPFRSLSP